MKQIQIMEQGHIMMDCQGCGKMVETLRSRMSDGMDYIQLRCRSCGASKEWIQIEDDCESEEGSE